MHDGYGTRDFNRDGASLRAIVAILTAFVRPAALFDAFFVIKRAERRLPEINYRRRESLKRDT